MAFATVGAATTSAVYSGSVALDKPTGVAKDDILFAFISAYDQTAPTTVPTDWTLLGRSTYLENYLWEIYYKVAGVSEGSDYTWSWAGPNRRLGMMIAYRGGFDAADPIDVVSNTNYNTIDTTVKAASVSASATGSPAVFAAVTAKTWAVTFAPPTDFTEDADYGHTEPDLWETFASTTLTNAGATGDIEGIMSSAGTSKHAFLVVLNPSGGAPAAVPDLFLDGVWG